jgi:hypothetical protein
MIDQSTLDKLGIKVEKKLFIEDVSDALHEQMVKLRLMAALHAFDNPEDRKELQELADKVEEVHGYVLTYIHG